MNTVKCPYCGMETADLWEFLDGEEGCDDYDCDCGKKFLLSRSYTVHYEATPIKENESEES